MEEYFRVILGHVPTTPLAIRSMIEKYTKDIAVDSRRIQKELGFVPFYNLAAGWRQTAQEMSRTWDL